MFKQIKLGTLLYNGNIHPVYSVEIIPLVIVVSLKTLIVYFQSMMLIDMQQAEQLRASCYTGTYIIQGCTNTQTVLYSAVRVSAADSTTAAEAV